MESKLLVILGLCLASVYAQGPSMMRGPPGGGRGGGQGPTPKGCLPPCTSQEMCGELGDSYKGRSPTSTVCIKMKSIRIPSALPRQTMPSIPSMPTMTQPRQAGLFGGGGMENLLSQMGRMPGGNQMMMQGGMAGQAGNPMAGMAGMAANPMAGAMQGMSAAYPPAQTGVSTQGRGNQVARQNRRNRPMNFQDMMMMNMFTGGEMGLMGA